MKTKKMLLSIVMIVCFLLFLYHEFTGFFIYIDEDNKGLILGGLLIGLVAGLYLLRALVSHIMWGYD